MSRRLLRVGEAVTPACYSSRCWSADRNKGVVMLPLTLN